MVSGTATARDYYSSYTGYSAVVCKDTMTISRTGATTEYDYYLGSSSLVVTGPGEEPRNKPLTYLSSYALRELEHLNFWILRLGQKYTSKKLLRRCMTKGLLYPNCTTRVMLRRCMTKGLLYRNCTTRVI